MSNELNPFERAARAQLQQELGRVAVPPRDRKGLKFRSIAHWGRRAFGGLAVAAAVLLGMIVIRSVATPTARPGSQAERIYLISKVGGQDHQRSRRIRAVDPATGQTAWTADIALSGEPSPDGLDEKQLLDLPGIDAALSPDGKRLYVADPDGVRALDTSDGSILWHKDFQSEDKVVLPRTGFPSTIMVSPDGQTISVLQEATNYAATYRVTQLDASSGDSHGTFILPENRSGYAIFSRFGMRLYQFRSESSANSVNNAFDLIDYADGKLIGSAAAPLNSRGAAEAADGSALYVLAPDQLWILNDPADFKPETENLPGTAAPGTGGAQQPRIGIQGLPAGVSLQQARVSPGGDRLLAQAAGAEGPEWWAYDTRTWQRVGASDPRIAPGLFLSRGLLEWSRDGTRFYTVMDAAFDSRDSSKWGIFDLTSAWNDQIIVADTQGGAAETVAGLPGEHVVRLLVGPAPGTAPEQRIGLMPPAEAQAMIAERAAGVMAALRDKDLARLATFVDPADGLRFSSNRGFEGRRVWTPQELPGLAGDPTVYAWGSSYAQAVPPPEVALTFDAYYEQVLYGHPYADAPEVYYNEVSPSAAATGGFAPPPGRISVEYHSPGPSDNPVGWGSLVLEFQQRDGVWYLRGIGHIFWSP